MRRRDVLKAGAGLAGALVAGSAEALTPHQLTFLGTPPFPLPVPGFTLNSDGYLVSNADGSLWVFDLDNDGAFGLDPTTNSYLIEAA